MQRIHNYRFVLVAFSLLVAAHGMNALQKPMPPSSQKKSQRNRAATLATVVTATRYGYRPHTRSARRATKRPTNKAVVHTKRSAPIITKKTLVKKPTHTKRTVSRKYTTTTKKFKAL